MLTVDARGRSCPEPVILTKNALAKGEKEIRVLADNQTAVDNITYFVTRAGASVQVNPQGGEFELLIHQGK